LGKVLTDKSPAGKMREEYALKFFSLPNCAKCIDTDHMMELMYLLPWTLQEEVVRSPDLSRQERLDKAILSFKLLHQYYLLSHFPRAQYVTQRFSARAGTKAVTFAEDSDWPRILNTALVLIQFVRDADEHWSFARLGTHCLENFFGFVRRVSLGDDRFTPTVRIITKSTLVYQVMHELGLEIKHSGRDNVGGTVIRDTARPCFNEKDAEIWFRSLIHAAGLETEPWARSPLKTLGDWRRLIADWASHDHHEHDPIYNTQSSSVCNCRITARNIGAHSSDRTPPASPDEE
jgi:hypothetical protein